MLVCLHVTQPVVSLILSAIIFCGPRTPGNALPHDGNDNLLHFGAYSSPALIAFISDEGSNRTGAGRDRTGVVRDCWAKRMIFAYGFSNHSEEEQ